MSKRDNPFSQERRAGGVSKATVIETTDSETVIIIRRGLMMVLGNTRQITSEMAMKDLRDALNEIYPSGRRTERLKGGLET